MHWWQALILFSFMTTLLVFVFESLPYFLRIPALLAYYGFLLILLILQFPLLNYWNISKKLLKHKVEREEIEKILAAAVSDNFKIELRTFRDKILLDDEIWYWESPEESWHSMRGRAGYVIVRHGKATKHYIITGMN
jgi:hypothetical protein